MVPGIETEELNLYAFSCKTVKTAYLLSSSNHVYLGTYLSVFCYEAEFPSSKKQKSTLFSNVLII